MKRRCQNFNRAAFLVLRSASLNLRMSDAASANRYPLRVDVKKPEVMYRPSFSKSAEENVESSKALRKRQHIELSGSKQPWEPTSDSSKKQRSQQLRPDTDEPFDSEGRILAARCFEGGTKQYLALGPRQTVSAASWGLSKVINPVMISEFRQAVRTIRSTSEEQLLSGSHSLWSLGFGGAHFFQAPRTTRPASLMRAPCCSRVPPRAHSSTRARQRPCAAAARCAHAPCRRPPACRCRRRAATTPCLAAHAPPLVQGPSSVNIDGTPRFLSPDQQSAAAPRGTAPQPRRLDHTHTGPGANDKMPCRRQQRSRLPSASELAIRGLAPMGRMLHRRGRLGRPASDEDDVSSDWLRDSEFSWFGEKSAHECPNPGGLTGRDHVYVKAELLCPRMHLATPDACDGARDGVSVGVVTAAAATLAFRQREVAIDAEDKQLPTPVSVCAAIGLVRSKAEAANSMRIRLQLQLVGAPKQRHRRKKPAGYAAVRLCLSGVDRNLSLCPLSSAAVAVPAPAQPSAMRPGTMGSASQEGSADTAFLVRRGQSGQPLAYQNTHWPPQGVVAIRGPVSTPIGLPMRSKAIGSLRCPEGQSALAGSSRYLGGLGGVGSAGRPAAICGALPPLASSVPVYLHASSFFTPTCSALTMDAVVKPKGPAHLSLDAAGRLLPVAPTGHAYAVGPLRGGYTVVQPVALPSFHREHPDDGEGVPRQPSGAGSNGCSS